MAESSSDGERSRSPSPGAAGKTVSKTFVWLKGRVNKTPRGYDWDKLNRDGRVKEIQFAVKFSERRMRELLCQNFPALGEADLNR